LSLRKCDLRARRLVVVLLRERFRFAENHRAGPLTKSSGPE
jgi:hypothetical protein